MRAALLALTLTACDAGLPQGRTVSTIPYRGYDGPASKGVKVGIEFRPPLRHAELVVDGSVIGTFRDADGTPGCYVSDVPPGDHEFCIHRRGEPPRCARVLVERDHQVLRL